VIDNSYIEQYGGGRRSNINWHEKYQNLLVEFAQSKAKVERLESDDHQWEIFSAGRYEHKGMDGNEAFWKWKKAKAEGGCDEQ
jgi:hypothetical protein